MIKMRYDWYGADRGKEFRDIYGMDVIEIPTNRPVQRKDLHDSVYKTKKEKKLRAVVRDIKETHETGQPVLVGTINIDAPRN